MNAKRQDHAMSIDKYTKSNTLPSLSLRYAENITILHIYKIQSFNIMHNYSPMLATFFQIYQMLFQMEYMYQAMYFITEFWAHIWQVLDLRIEIRTCFYITDVPEVL